MSVSGIGGVNPRLQGGTPSRAHEALNATKLSDRQVNALNEALRPSLPQGTADNSPDKLYAEIRVNGKVVAKVWETGIARLPNAHAGLADRLSDSGTQLAQERTRQIAEALGGSIQYANDAGEQGSYTFSASLARLMSR